MHKNISQNSIYSIIPLIRTLVIRIANYPDRLRPLGKFVENSTKVTSFEVTGTVQYTAVKCYGF